jgi:hypothetical protein
MSDLEGRPLPMLNPGFGGAAQASIQQGKCGCHQCIKDRNEMAWHMVLCKTCGNKRCPHATDHRHACTNSNDTGQPGSVYGGYKLH